MVADGLYRERINFGGKAITISSQIMLDGDTSHVAATVIDADPDFIGAADTGSVVVFLSSEQASSVLRGFTLRGGTGTFLPGPAWEYARRVGGGIFCEGSSPTVIDCTIEDNSCIWPDHYNATWGGGVGCFDFASPTLIRCRIANNTAQLWGGGVGARSNCHPTFSDCVIASNAVTGGNSSGGGLLIQVYSQVVLEDCVIVGNTAATGSGGAASMTGGSGISLTNCLVRDNFASESAGAFLVSGQCELENCLIVGNSSNGQGGGFRIVGDGFTAAHIIMRHCTVSGNSGSSGNFIYAGNHSYSRVTDCLVWGNSATGAGDLFLAGTSEPYYGPRVTVSFSDIQGGESGVYVGNLTYLTWGDGNRDCNPGFCPADYYLVEGSCCLGSASDGGNIGARGSGCSCEDIPPTGDADNDSVDDVCDNCPSVANADQADQDDDNVGDLCDNCPVHDNTNQSDGDQDSVGDVCDNCPDQVNPDQGDVDADNVGDSCDNCPDIANSDQGDNDSDSLGDLCDNCPGLHNPDQSDEDNDGTGDVCDNCPTNANPNQIDTDHDNVGDLCDNCPLVVNPDQLDYDEDGFGDVCDSCTDGDGDGYGDPGFAENTCEDDNCPRVSNPDQADEDEDGTGDACETCCLVGGDINYDGVGPDVSDLVDLVGYMFGSEPAPVCIDEANVDGLGGPEPEIGDLVFLVDYLFRGGPPPVCPQPVGRYR